MSENHAACWYPVTVRVDIGTEQAKKCDDVPEWRPVRMSQAALAVKLTAVGATSRVLDRIT